MLDDRVRAVLERLEREDADERERGVDRAQRSRAVEPTTGWSARELSNVHETRIVSPGPIVTGRTR